MSVYLDSSIVIYFIEQHPMWADRVAARLATLRSAGEHFCVSDVTRMECRVGPLTREDQALLDDFARFFGSPDVRVVTIASAVWDRAASIRAKHKLKPLDALHLAAAIEGGCRLFLTNDARLKDFAEITVEILS